MTKLRGLCERLCPRCHTWTTHRIISPRRIWQCLNCDGFFERIGAGLIPRKAPRE